MVGEPVSIEIAEDAVLGIILNHPGEAAGVFASIPVEAFSGHRALIAQAIHGLRIRREHIDMATVSTLCHNLRNRDSSHLRRVRAPRRN